MYRIDDASAAATMPPPEAAGTEGFFTEGNPGSGVPATRVRASWLNAIQEELRAVIVAGGITPTKVLTNQLLAAIKAVAVGQFTQNLTQNGWIKFPNGLIMQWGSATVIGTSPSTVTYPTTFPAAVLLTISNIQSSTNSTTVATGVSSSTLSGLSLIAAVSTGVQVSWLAFGV